MLHFGVYIFEVFFMVENKKKYAYWMYPSTVAEMEKMLDAANAVSKSDFVCQAVKFYIRCLHLEKSLNLVAPLLEETVHNEAESVERNLSEMLFKVAVELGYNNADAWKKLVRRNAAAIAEAHKIDLDDLQ